MRQFYLEYRDNEKLQPLVGEVSWSKNLIIMLHRFFSKSLRGRMEKIP